MPNLAPLFVLGAAAVVLGKKKKKKKAVAEPEPPETPPFGDEAEPPEPPGEPALTPGVSEGPEPGKPVASGVENHFTGAYAWKILFTDQGDYAAHYYSMGNLGPHEEIARGDTIEEAVEAFKFWAINEDRRKRNLPPLLKAQAVAASTGKSATFDPADEGGSGELGS